MVAMKLREIILADLQDEMKVSEIRRVMHIDVYSFQTKWSKPFEG